MEDASSEVVEKLMDKDSDVVEKVVNKSSDVVDKLEDNSNKGQGKKKTIFMKPAV